MIAPLSLAAITRVLQGLRRTNPSQVHVLEVEMGDQRVAWHELVSCNDGGLPSLDAGQSCDCRWSTPGEAGLHAHWYIEDGIARFHLDDVDPRRNPIGHLVKDTALLPGVAIGAILGLLFGQSAKAMAFGAAVGAGAGAFVPRGAFRTWTIDTVPWATV